MSWSVSFIGTTENVVKALKNHSDVLVGQSKSEYDEVLPNLINLIQINKNQYQGVTIKITAGGHTCSTYTSCAVNIELPSATVV